MPNRRLPRERDRSGEAFIEQARENHHRGVARFAIRHAQAADETAVDSHALQRRGKNFAAAVHHQQFMSGLGEVGNLPRQRPSPPLHRPAAPPQS